MLGVDQFGRENKGGVTELTLVWYIFCSLLCEGEGEVR